MGSSSPEKPELPQDVDEAERVLQDEEFFVPVAELPDDSDEPAHRLMMLRHPSIRMSLTPADEDSDSESSEESDDGSEFVVTPEEIRTGEFSTLDEVAADLTDE